MPLSIPEETRKFIQESFEQGGVVCLTGAGISAESGVPTFRGKGGLWEKYDPSLYGNNEGLVSVFRAKPQKLIDFIEDFYSVLTKAKPNPAHLALSVLEKAGPLSAVITQNIDNLHQKAGSRNVIEVHGNAFRIRCTSCNNRIVLEKDRVKEMVQLLQRNKTSRFKLLRILNRYFPHCQCGGRYRIDIVLFGEMLPEKELHAAYESLERCKTLLLVGTSLVVYPAASLPVYAKQRGSRLIEINSEPSALSYLCNCRINGLASRILPLILEATGYA